MNGFIEKYNLDLFIVLKTSRSNFYLNNQEDISNIYEDDKIVIYKKG